MISSRPYLIRGLYEWIMDNDSVPHLLVNANADGVFVPQDFVQEGEIAFDISPQAAPDLMINNEVAEFRARFGGRIQSIVLPMHSIIAIYDTEGEGFFFDDLEAMGIEHVKAREVENKKPAKNTKKGKPHLRIVE